MLSRLDNLAQVEDATQDSDMFAAYTYLGAGTIAQVAHPAVTGGLDLAYDPDGDDSFDGFDRFGRVVGQLWRNDASAAKDHYTYGYDRNSNRTCRENVVAGAAVRGSKARPEWLLDGPVALPRPWRRWVNQPLTERELAGVRRSVVRGTPWGEESWTVATARRLRLEFTLHPRGRPRKEAKK